MKTLPGKLTISAPMNSNMEEKIDITLEDEGSHVECVTIHISYAELTAALVGHASQSCQVEYRGLELVGKKREHKTEVVGPIPDRLLKAKDGKRSPELEAIFAPFEVDGWMGRTTDAYNHYNWCGPRGEDGQSYRVNFVRYIDAEESEPSEPEDEIC